MQRITEQKLNRKLGFIYLFAKWHMNLLYSILYTVFIDGNILSVNICDVTYKPCPLRNETLFSKVCKYFLQSAIISDIH